MTSRSEGKASKRASGQNKARRTVDKAVAPSPKAGKPSKLDLIVSLLTRPDGASLAELADATGWQTHSVRGALAGSLKKKGHRIVSEKTEGPRRYRIEAVQG